MLEKIEALRMKPKEVRNRYAFWTAFIFTSFVAVFWLVGLSTRFSMLTNIEAPVQVQGGVSRYFSNTVASFKKKFEEGAIEEPVVVQTQEEAPAEVPRDNNIDFTTFFSTSSMAAQAESAVAPKEVLIGTSSKAASTSTGY